MNYLQEIENEFSRLRDRHTRLSPIDWNLADKWEKDGVPLAVVFRAMEAVDKKFKDANPHGSINSLRYFENAVAKEFAEWQKSQVGKADYVQDDSPALSFSSLNDVEVLHELGANLEVRNLPDPLNSAVAKAQLSLIKLISEAESKHLLTDNIERRLEAISAELELSLVVSIPEADRARMLQQIKTEYAAIRINDESRQKLLIKEAYKFFGLPKLTLFEL